jgi:hypothetical protein
MDDKTILSQINQLADEEHALFEKESGGGPVSDEERERLKHLNVTLDRCWDLLRQRRARRAAGMDPDDATLRGENTVEKYLS